MKFKIAAGSMNHPTSSAFRLGDIRGVYPQQIDETFAFLFASAFARHFRLTGTVATGRDVRESGPSLQSALNEGFLATGLDIADLGLCASELGYFASSRPGIEAAVIVTASHNPAAFNGFKCVLRNGRAVTFETGLADVMRLMVETQPTSRKRGSVTRLNLLPEYTAHLIDNFPLGNLSVGRIALNGLNGSAATLAADIADRFDLPVSWFRKQPGPIPAEGADPTNPRLASEMKGFMQGEDFALGIAWDGDCDRCVVFDQYGDLVHTYYIVGLLARHMLARYPGRAVVFDTKLCWNTLRIIERHGGKAIPSETGHAFMKNKMREHNAIYGGELSSHHFFGDFFHCDSGMFAWLMILDIVDRHGRDIASLVEEIREGICCTPEINLSLADVEGVFKRVREEYEPGAVCVSRFDGLSIEMPDGWRFCLTKSKTEPLLRLNMECRAGSQRLLNEGARLLRLIQPFQADNSDLLSKLIVQ